MTRRAAARAEPRAARRPASAARALRLAPAIALLATSACFATQSDVRVLQTDVATMRAERVRSDSLTREQVSQIVASLSAVSDSMRALSARMLKFQGDMREDLYGFGQQLITIQELTGQSQRRLQELRSSLEERQQQLAAERAQAVGDTTAQAAGATPGPNQLFQSSLDQLRRGSAGAARAGFEELLRQHPTSDVADDAQFYVAEAFSAEGNVAAADSAYGIVVTQYPQSPRAPTALYKRALSFEARGNATAARAALNELIQKYPRSDEATLARERLKTPR
jgi:tol-pal system protein YbgF